jgi:protein-S-isoprenylcysteine O-methyltransferase Ste14
MVEKRVQLKRALQAVSFSARRIRKTKVYDLAAATPIIVWFGFCVAWSASSTIDQIKLVALFVLTDFSVLPLELVLNLASRLIAIAFYSTMIVMLLVRISPSARAQGPWPRIAALLGTFLSLGILLLTPRELSKSLYVVSLSLISGGFFLALWALLTLRRSISIFPEARELVTHGPYHLVRHPMYLGELMATAGLTIQYLSLASMTVATVHFTFQVVRMNFEERVVKSIHPAYACYTARTSRLIPGVY